MQFKKTPNINSRNAEKEILSGETTLLKRVHYIFEWELRKFRPKNGTKELEMHCGTSNVWTERFDLISMPSGNEFMKKTS